MALAERMGLEGAELQAWFDAREARERDERAAERDAKKEQLELEGRNLQLRLEVAKTENQTREASQRHLEVEERTLQLRLRVAEAGVGQPTVADTGNQRNAPMVVNPHNFIPVFNEDRDDLDAYLKRFERVATGQDWPREKWATALSLCLGGEALKVFGRLSPNDSLSYDEVKLALLQRFRFTADGYREKFRKSKPEDGETGKQYATRLQSFFDRWIEMSQTERNFDSVRDLIVAEQFMANCSSQLALFLREKNCKTLEAMAEAADIYIEAKRLKNLLIVQNKSEDTTGKAKLISSPRAEMQCFVCGRKGHKASDCRSKPKQVFCTNCRKWGHDVKGCQKMTGTSKSTTSCLMLPKEETGPQQSMIDGDDSDRDDNVMGTVKTQAQCKKRPMPVLPGEVNGQIVRVLRDTGSNTLVVRRSLVPDEALTGTTATLWLADGSTIVTPEAEIRIRSPYFSGMAIVKCMPSPLYDVIVGNVPGARDANDPDVSRKLSQDQFIKKKVHSADEGNHPNSQLVGAARLNSSRRAISVGLPGQMSRKMFREEQEKDQTLDICRARVGKKFVRKGSTSFSFVAKNGILYRQYFLSPGKIIEQAIVPKSLRGQVLRLAHENVMSGHQGVKKTIDRVLDAFYWPGVQEDIRRYVRSCDACQRTLPKGKVGKVPLGRMPLIDTPFERVAVDIIGPITPASAKGHRYILTLVDFATRYPDAVPLTAIDSATVAEGLVEMFSRIGFPREVLADQASCFTSDLMKEVNELLAVKHLSCTPYHPMCNGMVERFNGTLKQMLRKMVQEQPKCWDRLLAPLLFAYREAPQASSGFSPFELIYGRHIRGPLSILKELWTHDQENEELKTTYGYVLDLRERIEKTLELVRQNLSRAQVSQKRYYDRHSKQRDLKAGDRALILLPTSNNKLLMHWKGPFPVIEKKNDYDYWLDLGHSKKLFHINMLKKYEERREEQLPQTSSFVVLEEEESEKPLPTFKVQGSCGIDSIKLGDEIGERQRVEIRAILSTYEDVFSEIPGKTNLVECRLQTTSSEPVNTPQYPLPFSMKEVVEKEVQDMLQLGIIEPSESPYNSPLVLVKKPDNGYRACIDFRRINNVLVSDAEPIPRTDHLFAEVGTKKWFSKFDLTKGYWQVPLAKDSQQKTAFSSQSGHYHFLYMPFGIKTASAVFTRLMRKLLLGIPNVVHYIDDVLVATTTWEEHLTTLKQFFARIRQAGLRIKPQKCEVAMSTVTFLGHRLGDGNIRPVESTIQKITCASKPETKKQLRSFLGLAGYYRDLIPRYAEKAQPLTEMTRKMEKNKITWTTDREEAFESLKKALSSGPIVKAPDLKREFVLRSDASDSCIGAILMQEHDGILHPVSYASRQLQPREKRYSAIERECLALVWAIEKYHVFLYGTSFVVQTDHQPLQYLLRAKHLNSRVLRWSLALQEYSFRVEHIRGSENVGADYMSRL